MNTSSLAELLPSHVERQVRAVFETERHGKRIARYLLERKQLRDSFDLYRMRLQLNQTGYAVTDVEILQFFEKLQQAGAGKLVVRRLPHHNAFECKYQSKYLMDILAGNATSSRSKPKSPVRSGTGRSRGDDPLHGLTEAFNIQLAPTPLPAAENAATAKPGASAGVRQQGRALPVRFDGQTIMLRGLPDSLSIELAREIGAALLDLARLEAGERV